MSSETSGAEIKFLSPSELVQHHLKGKILDIRRKKVFTKNHFPKARNCAPAELEHMVVRGFCLVMDEVGDHQGPWPQAQEVHFLKGGMTGFRAWMQAVFQQQGQILILAGLTGSGKTEVLHELQRKGEQVLDLEHLARHKGSAFGNMEDETQLPNFEFQLQILRQWLQFDPEQPIWIEEEGPFLGRNTIPPGLYQRFNQAQRIEIEQDFQARLARILEGYGQADPSKIKAGIESLQKRLGMSAYQKALHRLEIGDLTGCFTLLLEYYDRAYAQRRTEMVQGQTIRSTYPKNEADYADLIRTGRQEMG